MLYRVYPQNAETGRKRRWFAVEAESERELLSKAALRLVPKSEELVLTTAHVEFTTDDSRPDTYLMASPDGKVVSLYIMPDSSFGVQEVLDLASVGEFHRDDHGLQLSTADDGYERVGLRV